MSIKIFLLCFDACDSKDLRNACYKKFAFKYISQYNTKTHVVEIYISLKYFGINSSIVFPSIKIGNALILEWKRSIKVTMILLAVLVEMLNLTTRSPVGNGQRNRVNIINLSSWVCILDLPKLSDPLLVKSIIIKNLNKLQHLLYTEKIKSITNIENFMSFILCIKFEISFTESKSV